MNEFLIVAGLTLLPAIGNLLGALFAEFVKPPRWAVGATLHGAAGVVIALVSIEMLPRIVNSLSAFAVVFAFALGAALSVLLASIVGFTRRHSSASTCAWMVRVAVGADLVRDGLMVGAGSAITSGLGLVLAAAQALANMPGGFAAAAHLRARDVAKRRRLAVA